MTKEQAVKLLDNLSEYGLCYNITEEYQEAMKLVLSMLEKKDKIIEQMTYYIMNLDIDEDICQKVNCDTNSGELDCKECIIPYFENKVKEVQ